MRLIEGRNITIGYEDDPVLSGLSFTVDDCDYLCIVGENGSGKSTFIKTVLSLIPPLSGKILFENGLKRNEIGYLPQQAGIQRDFPSSVMEVVLSGCPCSQDASTGTESSSDTQRKRRRGQCMSLTGSGWRERSSHHSRSSLADSSSVSSLPVLSWQPISSCFWMSLPQHDIHPALNAANTILHLSHGSYYFGKKDEYFRSEMGRIFLKEAGHDHQ